MKNNVSRLFLTALALSVLVTPVSAVLVVSEVEASSVPYPPIIRYRIAWEDATGFKSHGEPGFETREAAQKVADDMNIMWAGIIHHWVEAVDLSTGKVVPLLPLPPVPPPALPAGGPHGAFFTPPPLMPPPLWAPFPF